MSNILRADQNPPFGWYYNWTQLNLDGIPKKDIESALKQPETTRIKWDMPELGAGNRGRLREISADIVPDKAMLGAEYALILLFPILKIKFGSVWTKLTQTTSRSFMISLVAACKERPPQNGQPS